MRSPEVAKTLQVSKGPAQLSAPHTPGKSANGPSRQLLCGGVLGWGLEAPYLHPGRGGAESRVKKRSRVEGPGCDGHQRVNHTNRYLSKQLLASLETVLNAPGSSPPAARVSREQRCQNPPVPPSSYQLRRPSQLQTPTTRPPTLQQTGLCIRNPPSSDHRPRARGRNMCSLFSLCAFS